MGLSTEIVDKWVNMGRIFSKIRYFLKISYIKMHIKIL